MDVFEAIQLRRSIRAFSGRDVSEGVEEQILEAAIRAPSAGNRQSWEFIVVRDPDLKAELARAAVEQDFLATAPLVILVAANRARSAERYGSRGANLYCIQDCAAATQNLMLAATALGLGTCWVGAFDEADVAHLVQLPETVRPLALIPVGYPAERPEVPPRLALRDVVHRETF